MRKSCADRGATRGSGYSREYSSLIAETIELAAVTRKADDLNSARKSATVHLPRWERRFLRGRHFWRLFWGQVAPVSIDFFLGAFSCAGQWSVSRVEVLRSRRVA
jgi:hypothetical protein